MAVTACRGGGYGYGGDGNSSLVIESEIERRKKTNKNYPWEGVTVVVRCRVVVAFVVLVAQLMALGPGSRVVAATCEPIVLSCSHSHSVHRGVTPGGYS